MSDQSDPKTREDQTDPHVGEEQTEVYVPEDESINAASADETPEPDVAEAEDSETTEPLEFDAVEAESVASDSTGVEQIEASAESETVVSDAVPATSDVAETPQEQDADPDVFSWHPEYAGQHADQVRQDLTQQISSDQRQHALAMEGAEEAEHDALVSVVELERRWGVYDFDWAEQDAGVLAARIVAFEQERERRRELISWADYRAETAEEVVGAYGEPPAAELSTGIKAVALLLVVLLILVILLAVWAL